MGNKIELELINEANKLSLKSENTVYVNIYKSPEGLIDKTKTAIKTFRKLCKTNDIKLKISNIDYKDAKSKYDREQHLYDEIETRTEEIYKKGITAPTMDNTSLAKIESLCHIIDKLQYTSTSLSKVFQLFKSIEKYTINIRTDNSYTRINI